MDEINIKKHENKKHEMKTEQKLCFSKSVFSKMWRKFHYASKHVNLKFCKVFSLKTNTNQINVMLCHETRKLSSVQPTI